jgi:surface glycoprotein (TIGR04207 family)
MIDMIERKVKNNLRNRERGKILAVLLAVMLILSCIPAGIAFAASAPAAPTISPSGGNIYSSDTVSIGNITTGGLVIKPTTGLCSPTTFTNYQ